MIRAIRQWHRNFSVLNNDSAAMVIAGLPMMLILMGIVIGVTALTDPIRGGTPSMPHLPNITLNVMVMMGCFLMAGSLFYAFKKHGLWQSVRDNLNTEGEIPNGRLH